MTILFGIITIHFLVILRAKQLIGGRAPYVTIFFLTAVMVTFVVAMMYNMEPPE